MNQNRNVRPLHVVPWVLLAILLMVLALIGYRTYEANPFEMNARKLELVSSLRAHLQQVIEAEKNAVLAVAEQEAGDFAARARQESMVADGDRQALEALVGNQGVAAETAHLEEFNACWTRFRQLNEDVLGLATQSTNHKARRLSATQCATDMQNVETHLRRFAQDPAQDSRRAVLAYEALASGLNILVLHRPHIDESDDAKMDIIDARIHAYDDAARKALAALRASDGAGKADLDAAVSAYESFMTHTAEVLRLSRLNTNVRSAELTLGKSRLVSSQCHDILDSLEAIVKAQQTGGTR
jgi:hypothetical protein